jgi:hypothetical protein
MRSLKNVIAVVAAAAGAVGSLPAPAAADVAVFSGACTVTLEVRFAAVVTATPGATSLSASGGGTCVVNGQFAQLVLRGTLATTPLTGGYSCAGGVATGTGVVEIDTPGFSSPVVQLTAVEAGGVIELVVLAPVLPFDGLASLVRDHNESPSCATTGYIRTTWTGAMAFQDPYPAPL